jgi:hypothetical protein
VTIKDLIIDGNRPLMLRMPMGDALIELGNSNDQRVENCKLYEPRCAVGEQLAGAAALHSSRASGATDCLIAPARFCPSQRLERPALPRGRLDQLLRRKGHQQ